MKKINLLKHNNTHAGANRCGRGFALFYTMIMITVVTTIAFGLASITFKQKALSSLAYDSQAAFYAADTGMECALAKNQEILNPTYNPNSVITCFDFAPNRFGQFMQLTNTPGSPDVWSISSRSEPCFSFEFLPPQAPNILRPSFSAKGYSTCQPNRVRYVERNIRAFF